MNSSDQSGHLPIVNLVVVAPLHQRWYSSIGFIFHFLDSSISDQLPGRLGRR